MKLILKSKTFILFLCFLFAALFFLIPTISNCSTDNNKIHYFYVEQNSGSQFSNTVLPGGAAQENEIEGILKNNLNKIEL